MVSEKIVLIINRILIVLLMSVFGCLPQASAEGTQEVIGLNQVVTGTLTDPEEFDIYILDVPSEGVLTVEMRQSNTNEEAWFVFAVGDADNNILNYDLCADQECVNSPKKFTTSLPVSGTYVIAVTSDVDYATPAGSYAFTTSFEASGDGNLEGGNESIESITELLSGAESWQLDDVVTR